MKKMMIQSFMVGIGCTSMVECGWQVVKVQSDNGKKVLKNLHEEVISVLL